MYIIVCWNLNDKMESTVLQEHKIIWQLLLIKKKLFDNFWIIRWSEYNQKTIS